MKLAPGQSLPPGCAVVTPQCTFGDMEATFRRSLAGNVGHIVRLPEVKRYSPPRSNQMNRTVRGFWLPIVLKELGFHPHDAEYVYNEIKMKIGWTEPRTNPVTGETTQVPRPTAEDDTAEYRAFMEAFRGFVEDPDSGFGILLPDPDPMLARI